MGVTVSVILSTHDRPESLCRAVEALAAQTRPPEELILVNDGREDVPRDIPEIARAVGVECRLLRQRVASLPASRNRGAAAAAGSVLLFADDDVLFPPDYLARLAELYEADAAGRVGVIGGVLIPPTEKLPRRLFRLLMRAFADGRWGAGPGAAPYVELPAALRGRLRPAACLCGGAISMRRRVAEAHRFEERFGGYALGEDLEFCCRVSRIEPMFLAPRLRARHEQPAGGRPDFRGRARDYVSNMAFIAANSTRGGAGTWLLLAWNFFGLAALNAAYGIAGRKTGPLVFAAELLRGAGRECLRRLGRTICACC